MRTAPFFRLVPAALFLTLALIGGGLAAPAPTLRHVPLAANGRATLLPREESSRRLAVCGTRLESVTDLLLEHNARPEGGPLPTPHSTDAGEIAVLEDDGTLIYKNKGGDTILDLFSASRAFYRTHGDDYDFLAFYLASGLNTWLGSPTALAAAFLLRNPTTGIGLDIFDIAAPFGSPRGSSPSSA